MYNDFLNDVRVTIRDIDHNCLYTLKPNSLKELERMNCNFNPNHYSVTEFNNEDDWTKYKEFKNNKSTVELIEEEEIVATPAFIYAFDNLGPYRFAELCGLLLSSRYKGFLLGGVGADGKIDGEIDNVLNSDVHINDIIGLWEPESKSSFNNVLIDINETVIFQFKHIIVSRSGGQAKARQKLLSLYENRKTKKSEFLSPLIRKKKPSIYVLITNIEINSNFRSKFTDLYIKHNPDIKHCQIIGLDDLETWITKNKHIRHLYFPTIFGVPQFNLQLRFSLGHKSGIDGNAIEVYILTIMNIGTMPSYISSIYFKIIVNDKLETRCIISDQMMDLYNPKTGTILEPGRNHTFYYTIPVIKKLNNDLNKNYFPKEFVVVDEINNEYSVAIPDFIREKMLSE